MIKYLFILFQAKLLALPQRMADLFRWAPVRLQRVAKHFAGGRREDGGRAGSLPTGAGFRMLEGLLKVLDMLGAGEVYETIADWGKPNSRPLSREELALARSVFGEAIDYRRVRIDEYAYLGPAQGRLCYVSFFHINSWGPMDDRTLIHELVHVWQYQHHGIAYIPWALWAQRTREGYNYGGRPGLEAARSEGRKLLDFNYEQQADIVADYYCLKTGRSPRWGNAGPEDQELYRYFVQQLLSF